MLVFIDESGDTGRKIAQGSSRYFVVSMVIFEDNHEAELCDQRIELLKHELNREKSFEFHFQNNSKKLRLAFLEAISCYNFSYFAVVIDKDPNKLYGPGFDSKDSFYKYACNMVFTNARPYLNQATVILDRSGSVNFRIGLRHYLICKGQSKIKQNLIKTFKQQNSRSNNLLQLADYVSGIINRKVQEKTDWKIYYRFISARENLIQTWPK
ncbi:MAG: DUF3800 domain-containing protein [bacterium]|nr:DUF3800 domain-containing protein [bacterium]